MEKKPDKKDELTVVNNVLKLAADLLKVFELIFVVKPWDKQLIFFVRNLGDRKSL